MSQESPFYKATQAIYDRYTPTERSTDSTRASIQDALRLSGKFEEINETRHPWEKTYSCSEYMKLLNTYSNHQRLAEPSKTGFFQAIEDVISRSGGSVTR